MREESSDYMIIQNIFFITDKDTTGQETITGNTGSNVMNVFPSNTSLTCVKTSLEDGLRLISVFF
jgi:hypothetical protein